MIPIDANALISCAPIIASFSILFYLLLFYFLPQNQKKEAAQTTPPKKMEAEFITKYHQQERIGAHQCSSSLTKHIKAPTDIVWSLVRSFDQPQKYKPFVSECKLRGDFKVGTVRDVNVKSGLPATTSTERLELLDDENRIFGVRITGGDHRLRNYSSKISVHPETIDDRPGTLLIESFVVDVPDGNTTEETFYFVQYLINCNHNCLAKVSEKIALHNKNTGQISPVDY